MLPEQVVTAPTPWKGGLVAISSFGFGGSNVHAIIAGCVRPQGPPPRALTAPEPIQSAEEAIESGGTVIEEVQEEPLLFPPEVNVSARRTSSLYDVMNNCRGTVFVPLANLVQCSSADWYLCCSVQRCAYVGHGMAH